MIFISLVIFQKVHQKKKNNWPKWQYWSFLTSLPLTRTTNNYLSSRHHWDSPRTWGWAHIPEGQAHLCPRDTKIDRIRRVRGTAKYWPHYSSRLTQHHAKKISQAYGTSSVNGEPKGDIQPPIQHCESPCCHYVPLGSQENMLGSTNRYWLW